MKNAVKSETAVLNLIILFASPFHIVMLPLPRPFAACLFCGGQLRWILALLYKYICVKYG